VFRWSDGAITAAAIRDDQFDNAGVTLLCETFFFAEAEEMTKDWSKVHFVTLEEYRNLPIWRIIGDGVVSVKVGEGRTWNTEFYIVKKQ
jgi:hypothetical protein